MIEIYTDGGLTSDNKMCIGVYLISNGEIFKHSKIITKGTSHSAEELAVLMAIQFLQSYNINDSIIIYTDFISIVNMVYNKSELRSRVIENFPNILFIKDYILKNNIMLKWISSKNNLAHSIISDCYEGKVYNELSSFRSDEPLQSKDSKTFDPKNVISNNDLINYKLKQKDMIIKDLTKIINKIIISI